MRGLRGWIVAGACVAIGLTSAVCTAQPNGTDVEAARAHGLREYELGHYAEAVRHFRSAADAGDARSAEILCLMYRLGATLYDNQVPPSPPDVARWATLAADRQLAIAKTAAVPSR